MASFHAVVTVTMRPSILDPQGKAVEHAIASMGHTGVTGVRIGKHIVFAIEAATLDDARRRAEDICMTLLANPVMEDYRCEVLPS